PAAKAASAGSPHHTFVTLAGEVIRPGGVATGGVLEGAGVGALHKRREIEQLKLDVTDIELRYNDIVTRHYALQRQMGQPEGVLAGADRAARDERVRLLASESESLEQRAAEQREGQTGLKVKIAGTVEKIEGAKAGAAAAEGRIAELDARTERARAAREEAQ